MMPNSEYAYDPTTSAPMDSAEKKLTALTAAVSALYYAGVWHCDRPVDEVALWTAVRDAAGFEPGNSPKEKV